MNASTIIIILILLAIAVFALKEYRRRVSQGCCGGGDAPPKALKVADKNKDNYPYTTHLKVEGMTCRNCVVRVENALNSLDGTWAKADLAKSQVTVRLKNPTPTPELTGAIARAGYTAYPE